MGPGTRGFVAVMKCSRVAKASGLACARDDWRVAAQLVSVRWASFLCADAVARSVAFESYLAALDAEEAAAAAMARVAGRIVS